MTISTAMATNTLRESMRQPVYWTVVALTGILMALSIIFAGFALGEESKLVRDAGLTSITIAGLLLAIFLSSSVVADEIEKKTALTVLSKPVARFQFLLGKYLGIVTAILAAYVILAVILLATVWWYESPVKYFHLAKAWWTGQSFRGSQLYYYSGHYGDLSLAGKPLPFSEIMSCFMCDLRYFICSAGAGGAQIFPNLLVGVVLSFCEVCILASFALAVSTKASMILNVSMTFSLFILGHQAGYFVRMLAAESKALSSLALLVLRIIPNFELLNYASDIAFDKIVPISLIGQLALYTVGWVAAFVLLAGILFERREFN